MIFLVIVLIQVLFGINYVTSKYSLEVLDPFNFSLIRFLFAGVILYFISIVKSNKKNEESFFQNKFFYIAVITIFLGQTLFVFGLKYSGAINASIISISIPVFTFFISIMRGQIQINAKKVVGLLFALLGVTILKWGSFSGGEFHFWGDFLVVLACLCLAVNISISKDLFQKAPVLKGTSLIFLFSSFLLIPFAFTIGESNFELALTHPYSSSLAFCIIGGTIFTYYLNNWVIRFIDPFKLSIFIYLQPVIASILAILYLGELLTVKKVIAGAFIFVSVLIIYLEQSKAPKVDT